MIKRYKLLIILSGICFVLAVVLVPIISGGDNLRNQVIDEAKTNTSVMGCFGTISEIRWSGDRDHVDLDFEGNRNGYLSLSVRGSQSNGEIEVEWTKRATNGVEITKVWRIVP